MQRSWRVMGMWRDGRTFLAVLGTSPKDCNGRLVSALDPRTDADLDELESLWTEEWDPGTTLREPGWIPREIVSVRRFRNRRQLGRSLAHHRRLLASIPPALDRMARAVAVGS